MTYRLTDQPGLVLRIADNTYVPHAPGNRDYRAYQEWLGQGNVPEAAPAPPARMRFIRKLVIIERLAAAKKLRQAMAALKLEANAAGLSDEELLLRERWRSSVAVAQHDADARAMFAALGLDPDVILAPDPEEP